ncbi:MAG: MFS transporter [Hyphomicrobiales bacterium]|nr:MAG: MFS transporter [Hyphomicrobiales bacterium]
MRLKCQFADQGFTVGLFDTPAARDLVSLLPLDLTIEDYASNEKIAYLPRKLTEEGAAPFTDEAVGDVCTYAPWGNLVFFYAPYRYSRGLIRIGRIEGGIEPLLVRGTFPFSVTRIA